MLLFVRSQDIRELEIGLSENGKLLFCSKIDVGPEEHLLSLDVFLKTHDVNIDDIEAVYVVSGPGSFTASRVSITIANALSFTKSIPVYGIENTQNQSLSELHDQVLQSDIQSSDWVRPHYDRPAQITQAKQK
jgi:tRNA A37 threonylcarbamoyladenosine modification protein TsaB